MRRHLDLGLGLNIGIPGVVSAAAADPPAPTFFGVGASAAAGSAGTAQPGFPASTLADDVAILFCEMGEAAGSPITLSDAQGFVEGPDSGAGVDETSRLRWFWKRLVGGDTPPTIEDDGSDNHKYGRIHVYRGCVTTGNPYDVTASGSAVSSTAVSFPDDTTTKNNTLIVQAVSWATDSAAAQLVDGSPANAGLTDITERSDEGTALGNGGGVSVITGTKATAGAIGVTTATLANASIQGLLTIALRSY